MIDSISILSQRQSAIMTTTKILSTLALASAALGQAMQMTPAPFNGTAYAELMDCVKNASSRYEIAVQNGAVVIVPPQGEAIDLDSPADMALGNCLDQFSEFLDLAVDDSRMHVESGDAVITTQDLATAQWAESNGAQGMELRNNTQSATQDQPETPRSPSLKPRQVTPSYYFSLGNMEDNCANFNSGYDQQNNVFNECISFGKPYKSLVFSNPSNYNSIRVRRWPHHKCAVDYGGADGRSITVPARADSQCYDRPASIFSFRGQLVPRSCVGTCQ